MSTLNLANVGVSIDRKSLSKAIIVVLTTTGLLIVLASDVYSPSPYRLKLLSFALLLYAASVAIWLLTRWDSEYGKRLIPFLLLGLLNLALIWLQMPGLLSMMALPVAIAAIMLNFSFAATAALGQTALLFLFYQSSMVGIDVSSVLITIASIWFILGVMLVMHRHLMQTTLWAWQHFQQAQGLLEATRDRKAQLEQTLDDLAHANRQLDLLNEKLVATRLIAEEAQKAKAAFVAKVSHEFRTPLNMIIGLTDLLVETPEVYGERLPAALMEDLKIVHRNCEHLASMINDVLDLSQTETGRLSLHREWANLSVDIENALDVVRPLLEKRHLTLRVAIPEDLPAVYCDRTRIRQVILNLVSNAARYTAVGGITLSVEQQGQYIVVSVTDTGPGIPSDQLERIFEPFYQAPGNAQGGSGLGLSISKQFIELHQGTIWVESEPGVGSTFSFKLPISPLSPPAAGPGRWIHEDWIWLERTARAEIPKLPYKQRVIICDETGELYPLLAHCTNEVEFVNTRKLAEVIQELQECPAHAVILNTPELNHVWDQLSAARANIADTPIIGCTFSQALRDVLNVEVVSYLIKPVTRAALIETIQDIGKPIRCCLIVDDHQDVRQLLTRMLYTYDKTLEVVTASDGEEALKALYTRDVDLIILDMVMPYMNGWQILEHRQFDERLRNIPVVVISAQDPMKQPISIDVLIATMPQGIPVNQFLRCSLELSSLC